MAMGRERAEWDRTLVIVAMIKNGNCKEIDRIKDPSAFNPYRQKKQKRMSLKDYRRMTDGG